MRFGVAPSPAHSHRVRRTLTGPRSTRSGPRSSGTCSRGHPSVLVLEDDHAFDITERRCHSLCEPGRARWAHLRSVSKSLGPDLRLAIMTGDATTVARVEARRLLAAGWVSHLLQRLVVGMWSDPGEPARVADVAATYTRRREALRDALRARGIESHGRSGLNVWIPVAHEDATVAALQERGWGVLAGDRFRIASPRAIRVTTARLEPDDAVRFAADLEAALTPAALAAQLTGR